MIRGKDPEYTAQFHLNLLFVLADTLELALLDCDESGAKIGKKLRFEDRMNFNKAIKAVKDIRSNLNKTSIKNQEDYGDASDEIYSMIVERADKI